MNLRTAGRDAASHDAPSEEITAHQAATRPDRNAVPRQRGGSRRRPLPELGPDLDASARSVRARIASLSRWDRAGRTDVLELRRTFRADRLEELMRAVAGGLSDDQRQHLAAVVLDGHDDGGTW